MLSRDEEEARRRRDVGQGSHSSFREDEGVFLADFDDVPTPMATRSSMFGSEASSAMSSRASSFSAHSSPTSGSWPDGIQTGRSFPRVVPPFSHQKVQMSPRLQPEPMEAGFSTSPLPTSVSGSANRPPPASDSDQFPAVAVSRTPSSASASGSSASFRGSSPSSPRSARSAWSTPLRSLHSSEAPSPSRVMGVQSAAQSPTRSLSGLITSTRISDPASYTEEDADLRFAIELSLAEARSRGEDI